MSDSHLKALLEVVGSEGAFHVYTPTVNANGKPISLHADPDDCPACSLLKLMRERKGGAA